MTKKKDPLMEGVKAAMQMCIMLYIAKEIRDMDKPLKVLEKALAKKPKKRKPRKVIFYAKNRKGKKKRITFVAD